MLAPRALSLTHLLPITFSPIYQPHLNNKKEDQSSAGAVAKRAAKEKLLEQVVSGLAKDSKVR